MSLDPFTFEVLRHRLATITEEGGLALQRVSGSPLATEAFDLNTSIMSADGEVAFVGPYLLTGPMSQGMIARHVLAMHSRDGDVAPGDVFLCNDPYVGAVHQNCVTLVAPVHAAGRLVAWAGATLHVVDLGGAVAGQVGLGAASILDEAPVFGPVRIVRAGLIDRDVETAYLERARTPELNALDLRAKIAAVNAIKRGIAGIVEAHGVDAFASVVGGTIERSAARFRRRLAELPDGEVSHVAFVDRELPDGRTAYHAVDLRLEKRDATVILDFSRSAPQAPAVINCTRSGLMSGVLIGLLTTLVWDAPWCPAAIERSIEVRSAAGSVVDAAWPAGCSMATMAAGYAATTATAVAAATLLARKPHLRERAMASWAGAVGSVDVFGTDGLGRQFGTVLLDTMASGAGATSASDGIDAGGFLRSMACVVANVEHTESLFPLLYLYRRQEADTGGAGRRRGGAGVSYAITPHGVDRIAMVSPHFSGCIEPESAGLMGGLPGAPNGAVLVTSSGVRRSFESGRSIGGPEDIEAPARRLPGVARTALEHDDVLEVFATGGGGFGDPIEREPDRVATDVRGRLVSVREALETYAVALTAGGELDLAATADRRREIRAARRGISIDEPVLPAASGAPDGWLENADPSGDGGVAVTCPRCGAVVPSTQGEVLGVLPSVAIPVAIAGDGSVDGARFELRMRCCPSCGRSLHVERMLIAQPVEPR